MFTQLAPSKRSMPIPTRPPPTCEWALAKLPAEVMLVSEFDVNGVNPVIVALLKSVKLIPKGSVVTAPEVFHEIEVACELEIRPRPKTQLSKVGIPKGFISTFSECAAT